MNAKYSLIQYTCAYLEGRQYDQALSALGYTDITNVVWLKDLPQAQAIKVIDLLDSIDPFGYSLKQEFV